MPKRSRKPATGGITPKRRDVNQAAFDAVQQIINSTEATGKDPLAVEMGRRGGLKGGRARADAMTKEQRIESARVAAVARWKRGAA